MNTQLKKVVRDLTINPARIFTVIFALFLGIWGVGTVWVSYLILIKDLQANYLRTNPAHAILSADDFAKISIKEIREMPEIETAEFRDFSLHRIEIRQDVWIPLWLYGVEDFENFKLAKVFYQEGAKIPQEGSILIERDGRLVSNLRTGKTAHVRIDDTTLQILVNCK
jgi:hypothetical protein